MTAKQIAGNFIHREHYPKNQDGEGYFNLSNKLLDKAIKEYAKEKCKEQRTIIQNMHHTDFTNAPEPNFD